MRSVQSNIIASYVGQGTTALLALAFAPVFVRYLGVEAFGLIGLQFTVQALAGLLDMGLSTSVNRELAGSTGTGAPAGSRAQEVRDLLRTVEVGYWGVAVVVGCLVAGLAHTISHYWLNPLAMSPNAVEQAIQIMALVVALYWPVTLYSGGLMGLQRQVPLNAISVVMDLLRFVGGWAILAWVSDSIRAFFLWQALVNGLHSALLGTTLWRAMPVGTRTMNITWGSLRRISRFAAGMGGIGITAVILTHADKIILSNRLSLADFGFYTVATLLAGGLSRVFGPMFYAMFPRFSELVATGDEPRLVATYHQSCQLMSVLLLPIAVVLAVFSPEILLLWTRDPAISAKVHMALSFLAAGTALNGLVNLPYALQIAHGWTRLMFTHNLIVIALLIPGIYVLTGVWGAAGAALVWMLLNSSYVLVNVPIMHRRILKGELMTWYGRDVLIPLVSVLCVVAVGRWVIYLAMPTFTLVVSLAVTLAAAYLAAALAAPATRRWIREQASMGAL